MAAEVTTNGETRHRQDDWADFVHTGPGTLAGRYMRRFWQPLGRAEDFAPGRAHKIRILGEELTLYRGTSGQAYLVDGRCPHRGTQLSVGWVEGEEIRCFYHGWKFNGTGQCVEQPAEDAGFCQKIRIKSYPLQEYLGLIFAYLGDGLPPDMLRFPDFETDGRAQVPMEWPCNFFNQLENGVDHVHGAFVHRGRMAAYGLPDVPVISGEETEYGIIQIGTRPNHVRVTHLMMPNMVYLSPWSPPNTQHEFGRNGALLWFVPIDDTHHVTQRIGQGRDLGLGYARDLWDPAEVVKNMDLADQIVRGELTREDLEPRYQNRANIEDYVAIVGQGPIAERKADHLGRSDILIILLRRIWQRELRALAEGRELKQWRLPVGLELEKSLNNAPVSV